MQVAYTKTIFCLCQCKLICYQVSQKQHISRSKIKHRTYLLIMLASIITCQQWLKCKI